MERTILMLLFAVPNLFLIAAAVIPALALMVYVYRADKVEKEPHRLLGTLILHGIVATALAAWTEKISATLLAFILDEESLLYRLLLYFLVVGLAEEGFKYMLLKRRTWKSPDFNWQFDAVVYAVFVSLGFALWENIEYVVLYGFGTALIRAVTAIPGHACFGVFMGAWYGLAKAHENNGNEENSRTCRWLALICPTLLHGLYDFIATQNNDSAAVFFLIFIGLMFFAAYRTVRHLSQHDRSI